VARTDASARDAAPPAYLLAAAASLLLRVAYSALAAFAAPHLDLDPTRIRSNALTGHLIQPSEGWRYALFGVWERFDTLWYLHIAASGYDRPESVVFFPLYPLLIRVLSVVIPSPLVAALAVSTLASFFAAWGLVALLRRDLPEADVRRALLAWAAWPAAFVGFAAYPDALLLALIVWSVHDARAGRWWLAGILGFFAGLAKAAGIVVVVPLAYLAWKSRSRRSVPAALALLSPVAFLALVARSGAGLPSNAYPAYWLTEPSFPWTTLAASVREMVTHPDVVLFMNLAALITVAGLTLGRRIRPEYTLFALAALMFVLVKRTDPLLQSTMRYMLMVFPVYPALGLVLRDRTQYGIALAVALYANLVAFWIFLGWGLIV
jgi:hypothetical protein